jgi:hypothetical protein
MYLFFYSSSSRVIFSYLKAVPVSSFCSLENSRDKWRAQDTIIAGSFEKLLAKMGAYYALKHIINKADPFI